VYCVFVFHFQYVELDSRNYGLPAIVSKKLLCSFLLAARHYIGFLPTIS